jgi:glycosyltransferase involved in cell wall biosynthesis
VRVHVIVPEGFDDPGQPTGGNIYDRRVCAGLAEAGWDVLVKTVAGAWPVPGPRARADLARIVSAVPDGATVLIDGLIASPAAAQLLPHTGRIRMTVLLHMPLATALDTHEDAGAQRSERVVLRAATGVVTTSEWTRRQVLTRHAIPAHLVHVARPGIDQVAAPARPVRGRLICVGVLSRHKGQDLLVEALGELGDLDWHCVLAGPLDRDPDFVEQVQGRITRLGYGHRVRLTGVLTGAALSHAYATADLLVVPSRSESYGMTVTEALAHGLPVIAAAVGGLPEALGSTADGTRPGQLVPPGDAAALAAALGDWLVDERHRHRLRAAARQRRSTLRGWDQTTQEIANALTAQRTPQELQIAPLVSQRQTNAEVGRPVFLSTRTVEFHLSRAYRKLGVTIARHRSRRLLGRYGTTPSGPRPWPHRPRARHHRQPPSCQDTNYTLPPQLLQTPVMSMTEKAPASPFP